MLSESVSTKFYCIWCVLVFPFSVVLWRSGSVLVSISEVNLRRARLVLRWVTVSGFNSRFRAFISVCNQPSRPTQLFIPSWSVNEDHLQLRRQRQIWLIPLVGECGVCRLWDPLRTCTTLERLRDVFTTRHYTNPRLPLPVPLLFKNLHLKLNVTVNIVSQPVSTCSCS